MKKVGIIRCQQTEDLCPGTTDFVTAAKGKGSFEAFGECQIVGFVSCGGLSRQACRSPRQDAGGSAGRRPLRSLPVSARDRLSASPCPNREQMVQAIRAKIGDIPLLEYTH